MNIPLKSFVYAELEKALGLTEMQRDQLMNLELELEAYGIIIDLP